MELNKLLYSENYISPNDGFELSPELFGSGSILSTVLQDIGSVSSQKTGFNNDEAGYILGVDEGTAKFYIGDTTNFLNWTGSALIATGITVTGIINATSGFFGDETNGVTIDSNGLLITGTGYIRTASSGTRAEMVKNVGGLTNAFALYNSNDNVIWRASGLSGSNATLFMNTQGSANTGDFFSLEVDNTETGIAITTSGSGARTGQAALEINNNSTTGYGLSLAAGSNSTESLVYMSPNVTAFTNIVEVADSALGPTHAARITQDAYIQFPAYYHSSDFDETIAGSTALNASVIANAYWEGTLVNTGAATLEEGTTEDESSYLKLTTGGNANSSAAVAFGRWLQPASQRAAIEFRVRVSSITNTQIIIGMFRDSTHYQYFLFDTSVDANNIYVKTDNAGSPSATDTGRDLTTGAWKTFRIQSGAAGVIHFYIDDSRVASAHTVLTDGNEFKPYVFVNNKASAEVKTVFIDYIRIWAGRDNTQSPT